MDGKLPRFTRDRLMGFLHRAGWFFSGMAVLGVCLAFRMASPAESASAAPKHGGSSRQGGSNVKRASATEPAGQPSGSPVRVEGNPAGKPQVVAVVNNEAVSREDLARECLMHYGNDVLESMVNRTLILSSCQKRNIVITEKQIEDEIDRMARKFALTKDQWLKMLEKERGIKPVRYAKDIIWPTLALRELAKNQLTVTKKELEDAYESEFGEAVKVRLIALDNAQEAKRVHAEAMAKPEEFGALAKKYSKDASSASACGLIQPIRRHMGDINLEQAAFALKKGQISPVVKVGRLFVFVKCEEHIPASKPSDRPRIDTILVDALKDRKLRAAANDVFKELQKEANLEIVYGDAAKSKQMPGVAATINGQKISMLDLAEECILRYGSDVLEGSINRKLLEQALKKNKLKITDKELEEEIGRAAATMGKVNSDGSPDVDGWVEYVLKTKGITREVYVRDEVWPSVALKKLVGNDVPITQEDLKRGYEANYGPKIRCRAIVVNNARRAQEIWEKARANKTAYYFGELAEQYSIEASSRSLRGEVPPIQKNGGQPAVEKEAFSLSREEPLSGIIQVADTYVILFYEGRTESINASFEETKDMLYRDIREKKLRVAMGRVFEELRDQSRVDNYLSNNFKVPKAEETLQAMEPAVLQPRVIKK